MIDEVRRFIRREGLLEESEPALVAVSGGVDSMTLLHVLKRLGHPVHAMHVDHALRGAESDGDRQFVEAHCHGIGVPIHVRGVDTKAFAGAKRISVQMAARQLRYVALSEVAHDLGVNTIATAHHADDVVETLFLNLMRGTGIKGWGGIPARSGSIVRPLLGTSRAEIEAFALEHAIPFRQDSSDQDPKYLRNRVRHELLPLVETMRPGARSTARRSTELLRGMVDMATAGLRKEFGEGLIVNDPLPIDRILQHPQRRLALTWLLREHDPHPDVIEQLLSALEEGRHGTRFNMAGRVLVVEREHLLLAPTDEVLFAERSISETEAMECQTPLRFSRCSGKEIDLSAGRKVAWFDAATLQFPLVLRPWRAGDRMRPVGLGGSKLVSDILTDDKVEHSHRGTVPVLVPGGSIAWLIGYRVAEDFAATPATRSVWRAEWVG